MNTLERPISPPVAHAAPIKIEWHADWSRAVAEAFTTLPPDHLMDADVVRTLWEAGVGRDRQRIALVRDGDGAPVGVVPLRKRGKLSWQLLTQYVMPYARFHVLPAHTDAALDALGREIDCDNVVFHGMPSRTRMLRAEESWVVPLAPTYDELMRRTQYGKRDRKCRKRAAALTLAEDNYDAMPEALSLWQAKWAARGSRATAGRKDDLLLGFQTLASQGRLKTFSLHDGDTLVAMDVNMIGPGTTYSITGVIRDEYKDAFPGIRVLLAGMEWACAHGMTEYDLLRTSGHYKSAWAAPETRSYRLIRRPFGSEGLGCAFESAKDLLRRRRARRETGGGGHAQP